MVNFCKNASCPSSPDLLAFQSEKVSTRKSRDIRRHLEACEFCAAEVEFYRHYPQTDEKIEATEIPQPLYELAFALLNNQRNDFSSLNELLSGTESLQLENA